MVSLVEVPDVTTAPPVTLAKVEVPVTPKVPPTVVFPVTPKVPCNVALPLTVKASSIVVVPPAESIVKLPDEVSISLSFVIPIWILSIVAPSKVVKPSTSKLPVIAVPPPIPRPPVVVIFCEPKCGSTLVPAIAALAFISALTIVPSRIIVDVTVPVSPVVTSVPVMSGTVIVLSAVGFVIASVVSLLSSVLPSNTRLPVIVCDPSLFT